MGSANKRVYDISGNLKVKYGLGNRNMTFVTVILDEDPNLIFHFGDDVNKVYYPVFNPITVLGSQFIYGYVPNSERLNLDGYSFKGVYDMTNAQLHHFNIFFEYNQLTSSSSNLSNVVMKGTYRGNLYSNTITGAGNAQLKGASIFFSPDSNGTFSILDSAQKEIWRSTKLPICKYLPDHKYTTFYM